MTKTFNIKQHIILLCTLLGIYTFYFISSAGLNCSNDGAHMALASAMFHEQTTSAEAYKGSYIKAPDFAVKDGITYSDRLPGTAFLIYPFIAYSSVFSDVGFNVNHQDVVVSTLLVNLCGVISLYIILLILLQAFNFEFGVSLITIFLYGIATLHHHESTHLFSHAPSLLFVMLAVLETLRIKKTENWTPHLYKVAAFIGFATILELQNILFFAPICLYIIYIKKEKLSKYITPFFVSSLIISSFIGILVLYNYLTFDEIMLKSNKYNPFFPEEKSFFTALSGNVFDGLDKLFTSFTNIESYYNWSSSVDNDTPGLLVSSPLFLFSIIGFIPFYKKHKNEFYLFISCILIAVLIAAFHVTTLTRHIFTIQGLIFIPIIFVISWGIKQKGARKYIFFGVLLTLSILSFFRELFLNANYYGRSHLSQFPYAKHIGFFLLLNIPIILIIIAFIFRKKSIDYY